MTTLQQRFLVLLEQHVHKLATRGNRAVGLCPFHDDWHPSFSILVGESWGATHSDSRIAKARRARFQAERQAGAILEKRAKERELARRKAM